MYAIHAQSADRNITGLKARLKTSNKQINT